MPDETKLMRSAAIAATGLASAAIGAFAYLRFTAPPVSNRHVPEPFKAVDLDRYLGRWYEIARYPNRFEKGCEAVTAEYAMLPNGHVRVVNRCHKGQPGGPCRESKGEAKIVPASRGAKLRVSFFGPFYVGDYWVLDHGDDYGWSIVGEPAGRYLWLLARDAQPGDGERERLIGRAAELGYDISRLHFTRH
ncbi:MAG TPA: lipocalin family protein [Sphingomonas sp.]|nr:lipocalin family protein [Sphingomonas sp.]